MSYSNGGGGTLTLPSPTHVHHVDVTAAVRSLRRSLSRSPSKFRLITKSPSLSPKSPLSPSPSSPNKRASAQLATIFTGSPANPSHTPSPLAVPFPPSAKLALRSASRSKVASPRPSSRTRTSPKSPMKRVLSLSSDSGNSASSPLVEAYRQENSGSTSPTERKSCDRVSRMYFNPEVSAPVNHALSRLGGDGSNDCHMSPSTSSPLKRSDAIMNLDQASLGSPVAKRRSLHGSASFGHDFNIFDHGPSSSVNFDVHDDSSHEYELSAASLAPENTSSPFTSVPRRSSSLRKSTLQQRQGEKTSWGRRHAAQQQSNGANELSTPTPNKTRARLSMDQFMPPMARDSPFTSQGSLPNPSVHLINKPAHQPHPLSRTMTTSSSSSSIVDDSPTHVPVHFGEQPRPKLDFSKSLPAGSLRPFALEKHPKDDIGDSFSTPKNYKSAKPLPAAFMSTGLISKVNRNPEEQHLLQGHNKSNVPDTPCKKHVNGFATYPAPIVPGSAMLKARHARHSFGTPSTPFNPNGSKAKSSIFGKGGVFGSTFGTGLTRRGSFVSVDGDESGESPDTKGDSQTSAEFEFPPTPTKQATVMSQHREGNGSPSSHRGFPAPLSAVGVGSTRRLPRTSSKLNLFTSPNTQEAEDSDGIEDTDDSPSIGKFRLSSQASISASSLSKSRVSLRIDLRSIPPLTNKSFIVPFSNPSRKPGFAKISHVAPASPLERVDFIERRSPYTPQENILPPDPSGLSISNAKESHGKDSGVHSSASMPPPATPTAGRDYFPMMKGRQLSTTPVSSYAPAEVDESLTSRFEAVEMIGTGVFSEVFRVTQLMPPVVTPQLYFGGNGTPLQSKSPPTPMPQRVFAVKKSRHPIHGNKNRQRKLQEVNVLKALGHSDHVVHLIDSWEDKSHLYIQTEFCEEGSLDLFLNQVGRKGRLDNFRIWKIMLEIGLGLKHVHDCGFIHLDLKPANILITFEGVLKIGDFGMATTWPAQPEIEGEGDREYIGPEILLGQYDKPADIFAYGLIMLETAGNVILPDNGPTWQRLRSGDMSDVPSLTWSDASTILRDATGAPVEDSDISMEAYGSDNDIETAFASPTLISRKRDCGESSNKSLSHDPTNLFGSMRRGELHQAPAFMRDMYHDGAIDKLVRCMILPTPEERPRIDQVLESEGVRWVQARRRAGATVFEGNWGPADDVLADDAEMIDV